MKKTSMSPQLLWDHAELRRGSVRTQAQRKPTEKQQHRDDLTVPVNLTHKINEQRQEQTSSVHGVNQRPNANEGI